MSETTVDIIRQRYEHAGEWAEGLAAIYERFGERHYRGFDVGQGWYGIIVRLDQAIAKIQPDYAVLQVKEKFGGLRYYCTRDGDDKVAALIRAAEEEASSTCESCGHVGDDVTTEGPGWITTRCPSCRSKPTQLGAF